MAALIYTMILPANTTLPTVRGKWRRLESDKKVTLANGTEYVTRAGDIEATFTEAEWAEATALADIWQQGRREELVMQIPKRKPTVKGLRVVVLIQEPGDHKPRRVGKFVEADGQPVYVYDVQPDDKLEALQAYGVAPCVLREMGERGIEAIWFVDKKHAMTWTTDRRTVMEKGIPMPFRGRSGTYVHLPLSQWQRVPGIQKTPWATVPLTLDWIEPEKPEPVEMQQEMELEAA